MVVSSRGGASFQICRVRPRFQAQGRSTAARDRNRDWHVQEAAIQSNFETVDVKSRRIPPWHVMAAATARQQAGPRHYNSCCAPRREKAMWAHSTAPEIPVPGAVAVSMDCAVSRQPLAGPPLLHCAAANDGAGSSASSDARQPPWPQPKISCSFRQRCLRRCGCLTAVAPCAADAGKQGSSPLFMRNNTTSQYWDTSGASSF